MKKTLPEVELWPYILSKALLKIACLTWTEDSEIVDFNPISCLTGWICQKIDTAGKVSNLKQLSNFILFICRNVYNGYMGHLRRLFP